MLVKDIKGTFYEVNDAALKGKEVEEEKAYEAMAAEKAMKKKKIVDMLSKMDRTDIQILYDTLLGRRRELIEESETALTPRQWDCLHWDCRYWDCKYWDCRHWDCYWECYWDCHWDCYWDQMTQPEQMGQMASGPQASYRHPYASRPGMGPRDPAMRGPMRQHMPYRRMR